MCTRQTKPSPSSKRSLELVFDCPRLVAPANIGLLAARFTVFCRQRRRHRHRRKPSLIFLCCAILPATVGSIGGKFIIGLIAAIADTKATVRYHERNTCSCADFPNIIGHPASRQCLVPQSNLRIQLQNSSMLFQLFHSRFASRAKQSAV